MSHRLQEHNSVSNNGSSERKSGGQKPPPVGSRGGALIGDLGGPIIIMISVTVNNMCKPLAKFCSILGSAAMVISLTY